MPGPTPTPIHSNPSVQSPDDSSVESGKSAAPPLKNGLLCKSLIAFFVFVAINFALSSCPQLKPAPLSRAEFADDSVANIEGRPGAWWLARKWLMQDKAPDVVIFGSSQMGSLQSADAKNFNRTMDFCSYHSALTVEKDLHDRFGKTASTFVCALPGSMESDHYLSVRTMMNAPLKPRVALLGFSPRDFIDSFMPSPGSTEQFQFFSKYTELGDIGNLAFPDPKSRVEWFISEKMPLRRALHVLAPSKQADGSNTDSANEKIRGNEMLTAIYTASGNIKPGMAVIKPVMPNWYIDNTGEYKKRYKNPSGGTYKTEMMFFDMLLGELQKRNIKIIVLGMPLVDANRALLPPQFWAKLKSDVASKCAAHGASYTDFSDDPRFVRSDFVDTVHGNASAGDKLSHIMADLIAPDL